MPKHKTAKIKTETSVSSVPLCFKGFPEHDRALRNPCRYRHSEKSSFCPISPAQVHITFGV